MMSARWMNSRFRVYGVALLLLVPLLLLSWYMESSFMTNILFRASTPQSRRQGEDPSTAPRNETVNSMDLLIMMNTNHSLSSHNHNNYHITNNINTTALNLPPIATMEQYIRWHSVDALEADFDNPHRRFALVFYYCPNRAGNILHSLFNSVAWAIIHNRTILVQYETDSLHARTTEPTCQTILPRTDWWARWEDWAPRLRLSYDDDAVAVSVRDESLKTEHRNNDDARLVVYPQIPDVMKHHDRLVRNEWRHHPMHGMEQIRYIRNLGESAMLRTAHLYRYDLDFLFGMLFRYLFTVTVPEEIIDPAEVRPAFTAALHSRHTVIGDDGSFVSDEIKCLLELLPLDRTPETCAVYIMSDRPLTVERLTDWLSQHNCTGVSTHLSNVSSSSSNTPLLTNEMGPNQGEGYFRDVSLARRGRSALIGDFDRSSFRLLVERIDYERIVEDAAAERTSLVELPRCLLPGRYGGGYDYGPGTPTFQAHRQQSARPAMQVLNQYRAWHGAAAVVRDESFARSNTTRSRNSGRTFSVVELPCPVESSIDSLRAFVNALLMAIVRNETLVWAYQTRNNHSNSTLSCGEALSVQSWIPSLSDLTRKDGGTGLPAWIETKASLNHLLDWNTLHPTSSLWKDAHKGNGNVNTTKTLDMLYDDGEDYLYGMLFNESFYFPQSVLQNTERQQPRVDPQYRTLAVEANSFRENRLCLEEIISGYENRCRLFVIESDDERKDDPITPSIGNCTIHRVDEQEDGTILPRRNLRFLRSLLFVSHHVGSGIVCNGESSRSALVRDRIAFFRRTKAYRRGRLPPLLADLVTCPV